MSGKELFLTGIELGMSGFEPSDSSPEGPNLRGEFWADELFWSANSPPEVSLPPRFCSLTRLAGEGWVRVGRAAPH